MNDIEFNIKDSFVNITTNTKIKKYKIIQYEEEKTSSYEGGKNVISNEFKVIANEDGSTYTLFILRQTEPNKKPVMNISLVTDQQNKIFYLCNYMKDIYQK